MLRRPSNLKAEQALHGCLPSAGVVVRMGTVVYLFAVFRNQIGQSGVSSSSGTIQRLTQAVCRPFFQFRFRASLCHADTFFPFLR